MISDVFMARREIATLKNRKRESSRECVDAAGSGRKYSSGGDGNKSEHRDGGKRRVGGKQVQESCGNASHPRKQ